MTQKNFFVTISFVLVFILSFFMSGCQPAVIVEKELIVDYENVIKEVEYGTTLDLTGLVVKVKMSNGTYKMLKRGEGGYTIEEEYNNVEAGDYTIAISYKNYDAVRFIITIKEEVIEFQDDETVNIVGITIKDTVGKKIFEFGEEFSTENIVVEKIMSLGENEILEASEYTVDDSNFDGETAGIYTITVTLNSNTEITSTYSVTVLPEIE